MSFIPNTTPTPNWLYNGEMKKMNETELKVVLLVTRKTLGWFDPMSNERKTQDYISQSQFMEFTGKSNRAIATAIQSCVEHGWIIARDKQGSLCETSEKRRRRKVWYQLGSIFTDKISSEESSQDENLVKLTTKSSEVNDINLVKKVHNTKETITKETIQKVENAKNAFSDKERKELIYLFKEVNPNYEILFSRKNQGEALKRMFLKFGREKLENTIKALPEIINKKYAPKITTPIELENNLGKLIAFYKQEKSKVVENKNKTAIII